MRRGWRDFTARHSSPTANWRWPHRHPSCARTAPQITNQAATSGLAQRETADRRCTVLTPGQTSPLLVYDMILRTPPPPVPIHRCTYRYTETTGTVNLQFIYLYIFRTPPPPSKKRGENKKIKIKKQDGDTLDSPNRAHPPHRRLPISTHGLFLPTHKPDALPPPHELANGQCLQ